MPAADGCRAGTRTRPGGPGPLGEFLRARRALVDHASSGLPAGGPRRVPGLRREEVAELAGVSTDYYIHLERGRERHPSDQVLAALARVLELCDAATRHLFRLARPARLARPVSPVAPEEPVSAALVTLVERSIRDPAWVLGPTLDVVAANPAAVVLHEGFARFDNLARVVFLDPGARSFYVDWDAVADGVVGTLRERSSELPGHAGIAALLAELASRSTTFTDLWSQHGVRPHSSEVRRLRHPRLGELALHHQTLRVEGLHGHQLVVCGPHESLPKVGATPPG